MRRATPALGYWACLICLAYLAGGCASQRGASAPPFDFFAASTPADDPWFDKVSEWQNRARDSDASATGLALPSELDDVADALRSGVLSIKIAGFAVTEKRELAKRINTWAQVQSHEFYLPEEDADPSDDHWPTFVELLETNGDDCDGLDLIPYHLMLEFGYPADRIFRAIVRRDSNRNNHMVTFWFENLADPWVLDATGAMTLQMTRFSDISGWTPTKMFNERVQYKVVQPGASESFALVRD